MSKANPSLYFEEFNIGDRFFSDARTVQASDIDEFARISGDKNPIHMDEEFAKAGLYGRRIGHGLLGLSLVSGQAAQLGFADKTTLAFRGLEWKFKKPVGIGDSIKAVFEVIEKRQLPVKSGGLVIYKVTVTNQDDQIVQIGRWSLIIKYR